MEAKSLPAITTIVYCHNNVSRIGGLLNTLEKHTGVAEIIVVNDGSTDWTDMVLAWHPSRVLKYEEHRGLSFSLDRAARAARKGNILFFFNAAAANLTSDTLSTMFQAAQKRYAKKITPKEPAAITLGHRMWLHGVAQIV